MLDFSPNRFWVPFPITVVYLERRPWARRPHCWLVVSWVHGEPYNQCVNSCNISPVPMTHTSARSTLPLFNTTSFSCGAQQQQQQLGHGRVGGGGWGGRTLQDYKALILTIRIDVCAKVQRSDCCHTLQSQIPALTCSINTLRRSTPSFESWWPWHTEWLTEVQETSFTL